VRVDSGSVSLTSSISALASTTGIELSERETLAQGYAFGMAVEGEDVASFDYDGDAVREIARLDASMRSAADRFVEKCLSGLGAGKGRSFKGTIVLSPEAVGEFLLPNLISAISADAVRKGRSRMAGRVGTRIASSELTLIDDGTLAGGVASSSFDREGVPVRRWTLVDRGVLTTYLYNQYEARAAGVASTGHAVGSAASLPAIGPSRLEVLAGSVPMASLTEGAGPVVWVGRFSGSSNSVTGEFSGVVKNGFLIENGERRPVRETLIAGNLFDALEHIDAISSERRSIGGTRLLPAVRLAGVSVTAG
jgi:PmbA protein